MAARQGSSIRLWQTALFVIVIIVAILILSGSVSAGLRTTLTRMTETSELRNASALSQRLADAFPIDVTGTEAVRRTIAEYRAVYGGGIWLYDARGELIESAFDGSPLAAELENAYLRASTGDSYVRSDFRPGGWAVAAKPLLDEAGEVEGVIVTASSVEPAVAILQAVRGRIWVAFWISLAIAGLLGLAFAEFISRRIRAMSSAAAAIEAGDFDQRIETRFVPNELRDMGESYNRMATNLGEAFGAVEGSRREIAAVVESMAEGVIAFDSNGTVRVINPEAVSLLGLDPDEEHVGESIESVAGSENVLAAVAAGLAGEHVAETVEVGALTLLLHCTPLPDARGDANGAVLLLADVTEARRIEDAQRRFVADASHEMRTPIAALKGMLELLDDGAKEVPEVRDDFIKTMQAEVERLGRLVTDMLTLAQLEAGSLRLQISAQSAGDMLCTVARVMQTLADRSGIEIEVEEPGDLWVLADHDRIVQVLLSFTDNALKHSQSGGAVVLSAARDGARVRFEVSDHGRGISAEELARVFERFYRADESRAGHGTGLGLAIAKEIVEAHGSHIETRSAPGVGTTFGFTMAVTDPPQHA